MSPSSSRNRAPISLNNKLEQKILTYAAAAGAAGVSMLAFAQPGQAEIVYTAAHQIITANQTYTLDLNHDGITDFIFRNNYFAGSGRMNRGVFPTGGSFTYGGIKLDPVEPNRVLINEREAAPDLKAGHKVGALGDWDPKEGLMWGCEASQGSPFATFGSWKDVTSRYLGLEFVIDAQIHFGWARLTVTTTNCTVSAILTGYAYETVPGKPIATGETSGAAKADDSEGLRATLGALAIGTSGPAVWRRDQMTN